MQLVDTTNPVAVFGGDSEFLDSPAEQSHHDALRSLPQLASLPELLHLSFSARENDQEDRLAVIHSSFCNSIDERTVQQHAMVRWGDLHQRMTSADVPLMLSYTPRHPQVEVLDKESSVASIAVQDNGGRGVKPHEGEGAPQNGDTNVQSRLENGGNAVTVIRALQGCLTACKLLLSGHVSSERIRPLAMYKLVEPMATAGLLRSRLRTFVAHFTTRVQKQSDGDVTQMAFAVAVGAVIHMHAVQLQTCVQSVWDRRAAEVDADHIELNLHGHPTLHELLHHTAAIRNQIAVLARLCWCCVDEDRDLAKHEQVPMKWETKPFLRSTALLDHIHKFLATCSPVHTHMCRFLLGEALRPLLDELFCWTHSAEGDPDSCLSLLCERSYRGLSQPVCTSGDKAKPWRIPLPGLHLELPDFLVPLHDVVLTTGIQMRFLASLPQCRHTMRLLTDSAMRQVQCMRASVRICSEEPAACMRVFGHDGEASTTAELDEGWGPTMGWHAQAVQYVSAVTKTGTDERRGAIQSLIAELSNLRTAYAAGVAQEQVEELQKHVHTAQLHEQQQVQARHAKHIKQADELQRQRAAAEDHRATTWAGRQAERDTLDDWHQRATVGETVRLLDEVKQLVRVGKELNVQEARMAWRLRRWQLQPQRVQLLQRLHDQEQTLFMHHKKRFQDLNAAGAATVSVLHEACSTHPPQRTPQTFLLSTIASQAHSSTSVTSTTSTRRSHAQMRTRRLHPHAMPHQTLQPVAEEPWLQQEADDHISVSTAQLPICKAAAQNPIGSLPLFNPEMHSSVLPWPAHLPCSSFKASEAEFQTLSLSAASDVWAKRPFAQPDAHGVRNSAGAKASVSPGSHCVADSVDMGSLARSEAIELACCNDDLLTWTAPALRTVSGSARCCVSENSGRGLKAAMSIGTPCAAPVSHQSASDAGGSASSVRSSRQGLRKRWLPQAADVAQPLGVETIRSTISAIGCVPTEAALASFVKEPLLAQYRLTRSACMQLMRNELQLTPVCNALHDVLLGGNGQFLQAVIDAARRQMACFGELRVKRLDDTIADALSETNTLYDGASITDLGLHFSAMLDPLRVVSADSAAERLNISGEMDNSLFGKWVVHRDEVLHSKATPAGRPVLGLPVDPNDLSALDALKIRCMVHGPLDMLVPPSALTAMADVFTVLLRVRWASMHLEQVIWMLRKGCRHQPRRQQLRPAMKECINRLGLTRHALQVGWGALRSIQTHIYKCIQQTWRSFRDILDSSELDVAQCTRLIHDFAAECCLEALMASDAQLSSVVTHLVVLGQDSANRASELLLGYPTIGAESTPSPPSFSMLCQRVMKVDTWSQLQRMCADIQTRASFLIDCVAFKSDSGAKLRSLHTELSFNR
eukprot:jgi/Ulvmu1/5124/UM021_0141.1